ncbi:hypothetical protein GAO09_11540 [Rhizobiales bacterium RZME27]|uniref:Uncharacterized protein n=2 Tax=Endobacterium cereale TaxID=2663029 RepID=A0A6A8A9R9_9HYPH|nr:hypothetical protein [Endobacterium cereale]
MNWVPIVFATFKVVALGVAMYFAVKWHYDQGDKRDWRASLRAGGKMIAAFLLTLIVVGLIAFVVSRMLGLDLNLS